MRVVVFTCDRYSWLVPTFLHFYKKKWPDNPYQTDFVTETKKIDGVTTFCTGKIPWADGAIKYLESCNEESFLLFLEDYIITKLINTNMIKKAEKLCVGDIGCVRLNPHDRFSQFLVDANIDGFKEYPLDKPYSVSLQPSVWQKEFLLEILQKDENIWQTEIEGSKRIWESNKRIIWADIPILTHCNPPFGYLKRGKIRKPAEQWVKENW